VGVEGEGEALTAAAAAAGAVEAAAAMAAAAEAEAAKEAKGGKVITHVYVSCKPGMALAPHGTPLTVRS